MFVGTVGGRSKIFSFLYIMASFTSSSSSSSYMYSSICKPFHVRGNTLLIASSIDPAGVNIYNNLIAKEDIWIPTVHDNVWYSEKKLSKKDMNEQEKNDMTFLWMQNDRLLLLDEVDDYFCKQFNIPCKFDDIIFLSMHKAASGKPSLTVHPIGVPWMNDVSYSGGRPGRCSPPSKRIAALYRTLYKETKRRGLDSKYQVTLEATHHGKHITFPNFMIVNIDNDKVLMYQSPYVSLKLVPLKNIGLYQNVVTSWLIF